MQTPVEITSRIFYSAEALSERKYPRQLNYKPEQKELTLDSRGANTTRAGGRLSFVANFEGAPLYKVTRLQLSRVYGIINSVNVPYAQSIVICYDGVDTTITIPTGTYDISEWCGALLSLLQTIDPGFVYTSGGPNVPKRACAISCSIGHTWYSKTDLGAFATMPTVPARDGVIIDIQLFYTRFIALAIRIGTRGLLSSATNAPAISGATWWFPVRGDPADPVYVDWKGKGEGIFDVGFSEIAGTAEVRVLDEYGKDLLTSPGSWIMLSLTALT